MSKLRARHLAPAVWIGRAMSALAVLALGLDGAVQLLAPAMLGDAMREVGFAASVAPVLGALVLLCTLLYAVPRTAVLGSILITGFLGGAICTHFRVGEVGSPPQIACLVLGALAWGGLYLRDRRVRTLLPLTA